MFVIVLSFLLISFIWCITSAATLVPLPMVRTALLICTMRLMDCMCVMTVYRLPMAFCAHSKGRIWVRVRHRARAHARLKRAQQSRGNACTPACHARESHADRTQGEMAV